MIKPLWFRSSAFENPTGWVIVLVTVHRLSGLRFVIFTNDHEPAHVHVFGEGAAKINLLGEHGRADLVWVEGMKRNDLRRAMAAVDNERDLLLTKWNEIHG